MHSEIMENPAGKRTRRQYTRRSNITPRPQAYIPVEIVEVIFTFLPVRIAATLAVVAKKLKDSWMSSRRLDFGREFADKFSASEYFAIVNKVICLHAGPTIQSFLLHFDPTGYESEVNHWIEVVVSKGIEELKLDFFGNWNLRAFPLINIELPLVRVLRLSMCEFPVPQTPGSLCLLRTLVLKHVKVTTEIIETVINNCKLLETLSLSYCPITEVIRVLAQDLQRLRTFKISECAQLCHVEIDAPTLRSFHYYGKIPVLVFRNISQLSDVILNIRPPTGLLVPSHVIKSVMRQFSRVRVLTVNGAFLEGLTSSFFEAMRGWNAMYCLCNLEELQLFVDGSLICNAYDIASFIGFCPSLQRLFIDLRESSLEGSMVFVLHQKNELEKFTNVVHNLRFVHMRNFQFQKDELELVKFLLQKAKKLEAMVLTTPKYARREIKAAGKRAYNTLVGWKKSADAQISIFQYSNERCPVVPLHDMLWC